MRMTKAVVPAAGRGTRMRPFSTLLPKELVPLGSTPVLEHVLREALAANFHQIGIIVRRGKEPLERFVSALGDDPDLSRLEITLIYQDDPTGLADALATARDFTAAEPFAVLLPDNVLLGPNRSLLHLRKAFEHSDRDVLGVVEVPPTRSGEFGNCGRFVSSDRPDGLLEISELKERGEGRLLVSSGETVRRTCGRFIAKPHLYDFLAASRQRQPHGELDERPAQQGILAQHGLVGCVLPDPLFDVGHPHGVLAASAHLYRQRSLEFSNRAVE